MPKKDNKKTDKPKADKQSVKMGRPTKYTKELVDEICFIMSNSQKGLHKLCEMNSKFPSVTLLMQWLAQPDKKYFLEQYARARECQQAMMFDEIYEVSHARENDREEFVGVNHIQRDRLIVDTLKWQLSKLAPKKYGDKMDIDHTTGGKALPSNTATPTTVVIIENPNNPVKKK